MAPILREALIVFVLLQGIFGYLEYKYKDDLFYVIGRLLTTRKYLVPSISLPLAYIVFRVIINFLFVAN